MGGRRTWWHSLWIWSWRYSPLCPPPRWLRTPTCDHNHNMAQRSRNIQGTFKGHSRQIQGTFEEHSRKIQRTFQEQSR
jgi:hypothetical protein